MKVARLIFGVAGLALGPVALIMIAAPRIWYDWFPGVAERGDFNAHFVRDLGCAFIVSAASFAWCAIDPIRGRVAAIFGTAFICGHALVHVGEGLTADHGHANAFSAGEIGTVYLPALLCLAGLAALRNTRHPSSAK